MSDDDDARAALGLALFLTQGFGQCLDAMDGQHRCRVHDSLWAAFSGPFCSARLAAILAALAPEQTAASTAGSWRLVRVGR